MASRRQPRKLSALRANFEKKFVVGFFVHYRRSEAAKDRVKRNRHRGDDSITEMAYRHCLDPACTSEQLASRPVTGMKSSGTDRPDEPADTNIPRGMLKQRRRMRRASHQPRNRRERRPAAGQRRAARREWKPVNEMPTNPPPSNIPRGMLQAVTLGGDRQRSADGTPAPSEPGVQRA
jgi:hypothetical protein